MKNNILYKIKMVKDIPIVSEYEISYQRDGKIYFYGYSYGNYINNSIIGEYDSTNSCMWVLDRSKIDSYKKVLINRKINALQDSVDDILDRIGILKKLEGDL